MMIYLFFIYLFFNYEIKKWLKEIKTYIIIIGMTTDNKRFIVDFDGVCNLGWNNETRKKTINFKINGVSHGWKENPYKPTTKDEIKQFNGFYIVPDENYTVIDLDDMEDDDCEWIKDKFFDLTNYIIKTRRGYHFYYKYTNKLKTRQLHGIDIVNGDHMLLTYPSKYKAGDKEIKYELIKAGKPKEMPEELLSWLVDKCNSSTKKNEKAIKEATIQLTNELKGVKGEIDKSPSNPTKANKYIVEILDNLSQSRCDLYQDWLKVLMVFKNENWEYEEFDRWSKKSKKYDSKSNKKAWDEYNKNDYKFVCTAGTLWKMLKEDNKKEYDRIRITELKENYDEQNYTQEGEFETEKFESLLDQDVKTFKASMADPSVMEKTNSFKYFNNYHFLLTEQAIFYKIEYEGKLKKIYPLPKNYGDVFNHTIPTYGQHETTFWSVYTKCKMTKYDKINFEPLSTKRNMFNLFQGFKFEDGTTNYEMSIIKPYLDFVNHIFSTENKPNTKQFNHFLDWISHMIQKPNVKQTHCYVLFSIVQGVGKNQLINILSKIFEGYYYKLERIEQITDRFNSETHGKLFCFGDEIRSFKNGESMNNDIKNFLTQTERSIEYKGLNKIPNVKDYCHYIFTTNNENNFYIEPSDRRFNLVQCNSKKQSTSKFIEIDNLSRNNVFLKNLYNFFKSRDISNYDAFTPLCSKYKEKAMRQRLPNWFKWMVENTEILEDNFYRTKDLKELISSNLGAPIRHGTTTIKDLLENEYGIQQVRENNKRGFKFTQEIVEKLREYENTDETDDDE
jgi:hypothetical protein